jgi:hypothetical protein
VTVGDVTLELFTGTTPLKPVPPDAVQLVTLVDDQDRFVLCPEVIEVGEAVRLRVGGSAKTVRVLDTVGEVPPGPVQYTVCVYVPGVFKTEAGGNT